MKPRGSLLLVLAFGILAPSLLGGEEQGALSEARAQARAQDKLLFVYLDPTLSSDPSLEKGEALSETALRAAGRRHVVVRLDPGVADPEAVAFRTRYELLTTFGAGALVNADGACFGRVTSGATDDLLSMLEKGAESVEAYRSRVAELSSKPDDRTARLELARLHASHAAYEKADALWSSLAGTQALDPEDRMRRAQGLARLGRLDEARIVFEGFLEEHPDHPQANMQRLWLAVLDICPTRAVLLHFGLEDAALRQRGLDALNPLLEAMQAKGDVEGEAIVRYQLRGFLDTYADEVANLAWILDHAPESRVAVSACWDLVHTAVEWWNPDLAFALVRRLLEAQGDDPEVGPYARRYVAELEAALADVDVSARLPLRLHVEAPEEPVDVGETFTLEVRLENRGGQSLEGVRVGCYVPTTALVTSAEWVVVERLGPTAQEDLAFEISCTESGPLYVVLAVQHGEGDAETARTGTYVRIDVWD